MRETSANPTILSMILLGGATSLLVGNAFQAQMPEFAHDLGHDKQDTLIAFCWPRAPPERWSAVLLEGKGWLRANARNAAICSILWCVVIVAFAVSTSYPFRWCFCSSPDFSIWHFSPWRKPWCSFRRRPTTRTVDRFFNMSNNGLQGLQRRDGRRGRRPNRCSLVVGVQRHGSPGGDSGVVRVGDPGARRIRIRECGECSDGIFRHEDTKSTKFGIKLSEPSCPSCLRVE